MMQSDQDEVMAVELIRLRAQQKQSRVRHIWSFSGQQLEEFFTRYPTSSILGTNITEIIKSPYLRLVKDEHRVYFGEIHEHRKHGRGISIYKDGRVFQGTFANNEKYGKGYEVYPNGNVYIGMHEKNKKHGEGVFYWFNMSGSKCEYYRGNWWSGLPSGKGAHYRANGDIYHGQFRNGLKHGEGMQRFANGDSYSGLYVNGLPDGYGEYFWQDGSHYKGDFKQGLRNGFGIWKKDDKPHCESYRGHYLLDKKSGYGLYVWNEDDYYKGNFFQDLKHGMGELYNNNVSVYNGMWQNGQKAPHLNRTRGVYNQTVKKSKEFIRSMSQVQTRTIFELSEGYVNPNNQRKKTETTPDWKHKKAQIKRPTHRVSPPPNRHINNHQNWLNSQTTKKFPSSRGLSHDQDTKSTTGKSRCGHKNCIPKQDWLKPTKRR